MVKKTLLGIIVLFVILVLVITLQSPDFNYARSTTINAPIATVFENVNDLHKWQEWSPWAKLDPQAKTTFEGPISGVGAIFMWSGNNDVGEGRMTITETKPNEMILFKLEFKKPFEDTCTTEFTFKAEGEKTFINWRMFGHKGFFAKAVGLFMDCDKMMGDQFEKGFTNLIKILEPKEKK